MKYVDLGTIQPRISRKKTKTRSRYTKLFVWTLFLFLLGYGIYSFKPIAQKGIQLFLQGPSTVLSFLRQDTGKLSQTDGRTNFLLLGIDKRSVVPYTYKGADGTTEKNGFLSDTIIVGSYNQKDGSLVLFSLPRDLWVQIPAFGDNSSQYSKLNAAYSIGDMYNYPGGGLALSSKVNEQVLGIPIHYAFRIDFEGFEKTIDLIGGVDIIVDNAFDDYMYPREGYENASRESDRYLHLHFDSGLQHMDGATALQFVRSRHALGIEGSDFARSQRQQKVLLAAKEKALSLSWLNNPSQLKQIYTTLGEMVQTNAPIAELPLFVPLAKKIDTGTLQNYVLGALSESGESQELLYNPPMEQFGGAWVLAPLSGDWSDVHDFVKSKLNPPETEQAGESQPEQ